jgi:uncharacterized protein YidB (DUF937 family)
MGILSDAINSALRSAGPQLGAAGASPLIDALQRLLAPHSAAQDQPADAAAPEPDALRALLARFQESGYADIIRSWISSGPNQQIDPHQFHDALGRERVAELAEQTGMTPPNLLSELSRLLPMVIDKLTPHGRLPDREA